ncbi:hypothetical protein KSC_044730 [Ktedonobacter sp. SOSP1-52]|uniref:UPF0158 family protein n=1 Tax=Ktedonobacter sp. SOSP1-52 TaxID=2778366 RepID=UPI00191688A1|nr:UPF0158 family protein [Ktedonobacter sp. SOSP1-52]GHO65581.1 hypothetical protein KSC_044730 [Ktedonobacter sp. SOSP1-52]
METLEWKTYRLGKIELAMQDSSGEYSYYLNIQTGEVIFFSEFGHASEAQEKQLEEIEENADIYIPIEHITSQVAYQWRCDFVDQIVFPQNTLLAEKLSTALIGKGAFRRFKDTLSGIDEKLMGKWYQWESDHFYETLEEWFASLPIQIIKD